MWFSVPPPDSGRGTSRRLRRGAALTLVFASVLGTGAATGSWGDEARSLAGAADGSAGRHPVNAHLDGSGGDAKNTGPGSGPQDDTGRGRGAEAEGSEEADELVSRSGDRWSSSYTAREYEGLRRTLDGEYVGVGISVRQESGAHGAPEVDVHRVQPGSPADKAGIRAGDRLRSIDGEDVTGRPVTEVVSLLRGSGPDPATASPSSSTSRSSFAPSDSSATAPAAPAAASVARHASAPAASVPAASSGAGSTVTVGLSRDGERWTETLRRTRLTADAVDVDQLGPGATRIQVSSFTKDSGEQVREAVEDEVPRGSGILLDLRGNSGGLVTEAVSAASAFLDGGLVATYGEHGAQRALYAERGGDADRPLVVLVDGGTMSAAELLTGALQDRGRAVVVGSRTFGKGSVQVPSKLPDGSVAEMTVGHYTTPSGREVEGAGITPDLTVEGGSDREATERARTVLSGLATRS
ncbi:S41 family peptidase [Streptomyces daliensis]